MCVWVSKQNTRIVKWKEEFSFWPVSEEKRPLHALMSQLSHQQVWDVGYLEGKTGIADRWRSSTSTSTWMNAHKQALNST